MALLTILADGRVVVERWAEGGAGFALLKRQLSQSGLATVRDALVDVDLFDRDRTRELIKPLNCCGAGDELRVRLGDDTVAVRRLLAGRENYAPDERWDRFDRLVKWMRDPDTWLDDDAWADGGWVAYHAGTFCLALHRVGGDRRSIEEESLTWPAGVRPFASFGVPAWEGSDLRTGLIDAADAYAFASSIAVSANAAGIPLGGRYPVRFEDGGTKLWSPAVSTARGAWVFGLEALPPRSELCALAWG
jgi:hypothetical protein